MPPGPAIRRMPRVRKARSFSTGVRLPSSTEPGGAAGADHRFPAERRKSRLGCRGGWSFPHVFGTIPECSDLQLGRKSTSKVTQDFRHPSAALMPLSCLCFGQKSLLGRLPSVEPSRYASGSKPSEFGPCANGHTHSVEIDHPVGTSVVHLLNCGCPSAIPRFVVSVVVYAINRVADAWPLAHVSEECFKVLPSLAYLDAATPV